MTSRDSPNVNNSVNASGIRIAGAHDIDAVVDTVTSAFLEDPLWAPVFAGLENPSAASSRLWRLYVTSAALRYPWTFITANSEAAAVWYPPGSEDLTEAETAGFESFLVDLVGQSRADEVTAINAAFEDAHPVEPCFYLSLLATHGDHRGRGVGMNLLRESLDHIDALTMPAYLESSNPANDRRYASVGFEVASVISMPSGQNVTTMWRPAKG